MPQQQQADPGPDPEAEVPDEATQDAQEVEIVEEAGESDQPAAKLSLLARVRAYFATRGFSHARDLGPIYAVLNEHRATFGQLVRSFSNVATKLTEAHEQLDAKVGILENTLLKMLNVEVFVFKDQLGAFSLKKNNPWDAGYDVCAVEDVIIPAGERRLVDTGLVIAIPPYCVGRVWGRSGISANLAMVDKGLPTERPYHKNLTVHIGTIDAGYRNRWKVILENSNPFDVTIKRGDAIAQLDVMLKPNLKFIEVDSADDLPASDGRGKKGFNSSGVAAPERTRKFVGASTRS